MSRIDLIVRARRVALPSGIQAASVHIRRGVIVAVGDYADAPEGVPIEDAGDALLIPGLVDTHVHINDPGRQDWEGFDTATRAAAAGGVTMLMDMPLNSIPPTTSVRGLDAKVEAMAGNAWVDVGLCGGLVPGNVGELKHLASAGALAFKCFLTESGVDEFRHVEEDDLRAGMRVLSNLDVPLLVHAELSGPIDAVTKDQGNLTEEEARRYVTYLASRPKAAENDAVDRVIKIVRETRARAHIVHLSSSDALLSLRDAADRKLPLTAETCPHYLSFASTEIPDGATEYKCAPPIREPYNREMLWEGLRQGLIAQVVTDHSPSSPSLKCADTGDFMRAWGGIASLQLGLAATWTAAQERGTKVESVLKWMTERPARLVGLSRRKGAIAVGRDADLVFWDPDADFEVDASKLEHRHKLTPYARKTLKGKVRATFVRGVKVFEGGEFRGNPTGSFVTRGDVTL